MLRPSVWLVGTDDMHLRLPLVTALQVRGFQVDVLGTVADEAFARAGVPYRRYRLGRRVDPVGDWTAWRQLGRLMREHRPDIVHAFDKKPAILAPLAAHAADVRGTVTTVTGLGYLFSSNTPLTVPLRAAFELLQRRAARVTEVMIFQNSEDQTYFRSHGLVRPGHDCLVRSSGIAPDAFRVSAEATASLRAGLGLSGRIVVLMVSRMLALKGVREFLRAAAMVRLERPEITLLLAGPVAGEGRQAVPLEELRRAGAAVRYLGPRQDIPALLSVADLFVLPTYYREGVPRVLLEAAAAGLPLVTTDVPGCRDVVRNGWNGLLIPPRNAPALADAILRLAAAPELRATMGRRSRDHVVAQFSLDQVADGYANVYDGLLTGAHQMASAHPA
jgi:glycosyltransferase involved in cell wall biosynthesis